MITIANANALHIPLPDQSVQCIVTSPPYYGLRDYGTAKWKGGSSECDHVSGLSRQDGNRDTPGGRGGSFSAPEEHYRNICAKCGARRIDAQIGLEPAPAAYVANIVAVMRECWRVLKDDGVLWLNLGDSYASGEIGRHDSVQANNGNGWTGTRKMKERKQIKLDTGLKPKDLIGIPWRVAFALQDDGWYLRQDIIWSKSNPMPESVTDRCTKAHEYVFLLTKRARYYYDAEAIKESYKRDDYDFSDWDKRKQHGAIGGAMITGANQQQGIGISHDLGNGSGRNRRSVWTVATSPYSGAHFATFPPALIEPMILAGTSQRGECPHCGKAWVRVVERTEQSYYQERKQHDFSGRKADNAPHDGYKSISHGRPENSGIGYSSNQTIDWQPQCACPPHDPIPQTVLDPFAGSGTTGAVAVKHGRRAVLLDLNTKYIDLQFERTNGIQITMPFETIAPNSPA